MFDAIFVEKDEAGYRAQFTSLDEAALPPGDVQVRVAYSTINYKDALAIIGKGPVVCQFPMVPGIDLVGVVETSSHPGYAPGDTVLLNGWGILARPGIFYTAKCRGISMTARAAIGRTLGPHHPQLFAAADRSR